MAVSPSKAAFMELTAQETVLGLPRVVDEPPPVALRAGKGARGVLETVLLDALDTPPCQVLFSGGRDSSALLALAVYLARREGRPAPVPVTVRHPDAPEANEDDWQVLVLEHLGLRERIVLDFRGEQTLLGDVAIGALRRHGPVWPEAVQLHGAVYQHLTAGCVVSGEGGDMILSGHRMGTVRQGLALRRPRRRNVRRALRALQPAALNRRAAAARINRGDGHVPAWLRASALDVYRDQVMAMCVEPLRWDRSIRATLYSRPAVVSIANFEAGITEYGLRPVTPFAEPEFVDALAQEAGPFGWGDRTAVFRRLFGDLLPDEVLRRGTKASFNSTRWSDRERQFARDWDGSGFDTEWLDPELLRAEWLTPDPHPVADFQLHVAWAISQGIPVTGDQP